MLTKPKPPALLDIDSGGLKLVDSPSCLVLQSTAISEDTPNGYAPAYETLLWNGRDKSPSCDLRHFLIKRCRFSTVTMSPVKNGQIRSFLCPRSTVLD